MSDYAYRDSVPIEEHEKLEKDFYKQQRKLGEARRIISNFICSQISYMTVNNLGDPFKQQDIKQAVKFLTEDE